MPDYLLLLFGVLLAGTGGELFVRGTTGMAHAARVSPAIIGVTISAFATSSPELSVALNAGITGKTGIAFGDALGSNVVNIACILGLALTISGVRMQESTIRRDFTVALTVPLLTAFLIVDGELSRTDGAVMIALFLAWLLAALAEARRQPAMETTKTVLSALGGLGMLVLSGRLIVRSTTGIALALGMDNFLVGAVIVALGTSMPELASTMIAKIRGEDDMGLGTVLGSNIFNGLLITGIAAVFKPIRINLKETLTALLFGLLAIIVIAPLKRKTIRRKQGVILLGLYVLYLVIMLH
jgi:cation:H+ antiporter